MKSKQYCTFCGDSNTKIVITKEPDSGVKIGEREVIDPNARPMMKCSNHHCGKIHHVHCLNKLGSRKGIIFKETICPICDSKMILL